MMQKMMFILLTVAAVSLYVSDASAQEKTAKLKVSKMTCSTCPISVRHRVMQMKGIYAAIVDYDPETSTASVTVTYEDKEQSPKAIAEAITQFGYPASVEMAAP